MAAPESGRDAEPTRRGWRTRETAVWLALRYYGRALLRHRLVSVPALLLPALGNVCLFYLAPLIVAGLVGRLAGGQDVGVAAVLLPYVLGFAALTLLGEALWRAGVHCLNRTDGRGIEHLAVVGMDELLAKDAAFFHGTFADSLTKRVLSFAARFEEFVDTLTFSVVRSTSSPTASRSRFGGSSPTCSPPRASPPRPGRCRLA